ncbi:MAG TPA: hypothetical protein VMS89_00010 [Methanoregulaceae archaeon]|nr:hypothetical protein [Methanoregulaceae archaeon]
MGSLEDKMARLSPEQRREVENFIDFVLQKKSSAGDSLPGPAQEGQIPPVIYAEEKPSAAPPAVPDPLPSLEDLRKHDVPTGKKDSTARSERQKGKDPGLLLDWIE